MPKRKQTEWRQLAQQRIADAPKIAKQAKDQGEAVLSKLDEVGCSTCDPMILMDESGSGVHITHDLSCPSR